LFSDEPLSTSTVAFVQESVSKHETSQLPSQWMCDRKQEELSLHFTRHCGPVQTTVVSAHELPVVHSTSLDVGLGVGGGKVGFADGVAEGG
jgi:hypothetical protein